MAIDAAKRLAEDVSDKQAKDLALGIRLYSFACFVD
jgi:hypothetical protein